MHVLVVGARAEQLRVARLKLLLELAEGGDLGGAYKGEVLGPEEHDLPFAGKALVGDRLERLLRVAADHACQGELGKLTAYACHGYDSL